ncbi:MAG: UDP-N-acetylmuramate--L-alanine ligase [Alistipes sp.]|nr:UDP-N-acetylmuramate--L-alanine ligase [Candidatus Minthomonas equi]
MKNIYLIGIGGIGMSAIARFYNHFGYNVSGYDRTKSQLTAELESEGIRIHYEDCPSLVPEDTENTLVIYTPAIPDTLKEIQLVHKKGYRIIKRSRALGEIATDKKCLAVSGTHGKTTTSTLLAHILTASGKGCNAFLGGISKNYDTNLLLSREDTLVAEADEFDRSFLQLFPDIAVVTAMDADHLDIYGDVSHVREAFVAFGMQVKKALIVKKGLETYFNAASARVYTYSYDDSTADFHAADIELRTGGYLSFSIVTPMGVIPDCTVGVPGWVNVENAVAATASATIFGVPAEEIRKALKSFCGVKRRFDIHINTERCTYVDDYAHHPAELAAAISSIRNIFPGRKITGVFQPHLYTRTRDFKDEFAASLSLLDEVILLPIYPAREQAIEGVSSETILEKITCPRKKICQKDELISEISSRDIEILCTFGAGDIDRLCPQIENALKERFSC